MKISDACVGCGQCKAYCPRDAIMVFGRASINERCTKCSICIRYCPVRAISED